jgi:ribosomal-protein-alanine N-acetyltransferase
MMVSTETQTVWRRARRDDLDVLLDIERRSFEVPWTSGEMEEEFELDYSRPWVAEQNGRVVAFGIHWLIAGESQLADIAVHPDFQRRGLGRRMLEKLLDDARSSGMRKMTLEVRAGNTAAIELYLKRGFVETSRRPRYYEGREEAVLMEISFEK